MPEKLYTTLNPHEQPKELGIEFVLLWRGKLQCFKLGSIRSDRLDFVDRGAGKLIALISRHMTDYGERVRVHKVIEPNS